jgi:hypothetical protein
MFRVIYTGVLRPELGLAHCRAPRFDTLRCDHVNNLRTITQCGSENLLDYMYVTLAYHLILPLLMFHFFFFFPEYITGDFICQQAIDRGYSITWL